MPNTGGNINCRTLFNTHPGVAQDAKTVPFQNEQHLICFIVLMDRDAGTYRNLLCPQGHIVRTPAGFNLDIDTSSIAKEVFALSGAQHIPLFNHVLHLRDVAEYYVSTCPPVYLAYPLGGNSLTCGKS